MILGDVVQFETGKGIVEARIVEVKRLVALGITLENCPFSVYDFLANGILAEYDGLLGLDFFKGKKVCIDFREMVITMS